MPLAALAFLHVAAGLAAAVAYAGELRASPRASWTLPGFAALGLHEVFVALPGAFYLLARHTDWALSYVLATGKVPSALALLVAMAIACSGLAGFVLGARLVRNQHPRVATSLAAGLTTLALAGIFLTKTRVAMVGTTSQFRGGFGMVPFWSSRASTAVLLVAMIQGAAFAHLAWSLSRDRRPPRA